MSSRYKFQVLQGSNISLVRGCGENVLQPVDVFKCQIFSSEVSASVGMLHYESSATVSLLYFRFVVDVVYFLLRQ
jgi:hypothetical protein